MHSRSYTFKSRSSLGGENTETGGAAFQMVPGVHGRPVPSLLFLLCAAFLSAGRHICPAAPRSTGETFANAELPRVVTLAHRWLARLIVHGWAPGLA